MVAAEAPSRFSFRWVQGVDDPARRLDDPRNGPSTLVEFRLESVPEGTRVHQVESGFATLATDDLAETLQTRAPGLGHYLGHAGDAFRDTMTPVAQVFHALGDPVRLEMVQRLSRNQPCTIDTVSRDLGISRQGARKHLQVLVDAQLVLLEPHGREVRVRLEAAALDQVKAFIGKLERDWDRRLEALRRFVEQS